MRTMLSLDQDQMKVISCVYTMLSFHQDQMKSIFNWYALLSLDENQSQMSTRHNGTLISVGLLCTEYNTLSDLYQVFKSILSK